MKTIQINNIEELKEIINNQEKEFVFFLEFDGERSEDNGKSESGCNK